MRFFFTAVVLAAVPAFVRADVHNVTVGAGGLLKFDPQNITASTGDQVNFMFMAKNHSVTQNSFDDPCVQLMVNGTAGINSGFLAIPPNTTFSNDSTPTWTITVQDNSKPLWFHCAQTMPVVHCEKGMVFSINATPQKTFDMYLANAMASNVTATAPPPPPPPSDASANSTDSGTSGGASANSTDSGAAAAAPNDATAAAPSDAATAAAPSDAAAAAAPTDAAAASSDATTAPTDAAAASSDATTAPTDAAADPSGTAAATSGQ